MEFLTPRYEHKDSLIFWNVIEHSYGIWSVWDGLEFCDFYYVQHIWFKKIKKIKIFGYKKYLSNENK
jgi:hypothetical protein